MELFAPPHKAAIFHVLHQDMGPALRPFDARAWLGPGFSPTITSISTRKDCGFRHQEGPTITRVKRASLYWIDCLAQFHKSFGNG